MYSHTAGFLEAPALREVSTLDAHGAILPKPSLSRANSAAISILPISTTGIRQRLTEQYSMRNTTVFRRMQTTARLTPAIHILTAARLAPAAHIRTGLIL